MNDDLVEDIVRRSARIGAEDIARLDLDEALSAMLAEIAGESRTQRQRPRRGALGRYGPPALRIALPRPAVAVLLVVGALAASIAAVPSVRAAISELGDTLTGYFDEEDPPGQPVEGSDSLPAWLAEDGRTGQRLLASSDGYELYLVRQPSGAYGFALDESVGITDSVEGWERQFAANAAVVLGRGPSTDAGARVPLYGVSAASVAAVQVRYDSGPASTAPAQTGGFVVMIEPARGPTELAALDRDGEPLQVLDVRRFASGQQERFPRRSRTGRAEGSQRPVEIVGEPPPDR